MPPQIPTVQTPPTTERPQRQPVGPWIGAFIVVLLLLFGALYFWGAHVSEAPEEPLPLISGTPVQAQ